MQTKLTLRLDSALIERAKAVARQRQTSVSQMVADYFSLLGRLNEPIPDDLPPLTRMLWGALAGAAYDKEQYTDYLEEKYR